MFYVRFEKEIDNNPLPSCLPLVTAPKWQCRFCSNFVRLTYTEFYGYYFLNFGLVWLTVRLLHLRELNNFI